MEFALTNAWQAYAAVAYAVFVFYVVNRLLNAKKLAGIVPRVFVKYQERIAELERLDPMQQSRLRREAAKLESADEQALANENYAEEDEGSEY